MTLNPHRREDQLVSTEAKIENKRVLIDKNVARKPLVTILRLFSHLTAKMSYVKYNPRAKLMSKDSTTSKTVLPHCIDVKNWKAKSRGVHKVHQHS